MYSTHGLNSTLLSEGSVLEVDPVWEQWARQHSKDRWGGKEPPYAQVQLKGQPAVMSAR